MATQAKSSRLFENKYLEAATHVHPITPLVLWTPVIAYLLWTSSAYLNFSHYVFWFVVGILTWTLSEYFVHKLAFHYEAKSRFGKYLVFLFHGIHHDEPDDATRLVMPPVPAIVLSGGFYLVFAFLVGHELARPWYAFFMVGYLCYDYIHYATHHFACKGRVMKMIKRHHMLHHHLVKDGNFGVSSPFWDIVFGTYRDRVKK